jgi:hypothetical protein
VEESLWTFVRVEGMEPTNNHIERMLRLAVLWRKKSFGSQSESGCRLVERLLTVVPTRKLQDRSVMEYLYEAIVAHRAGLPAPKLLEPAGRLSSFFFPGGRNAAKGWHAFGGHRSGRPHFMPWLPAYRTLHSRIPPDQSGCSCTSRRRAVVLTGVNVTRL